jgi:hypothetical protein
LCSKQVGTLRRKLKTVILESSGGNSATEKERQTMKKLMTVLVFAGSAALVMADGGSIQDPATVVTTAQTLAATITTVGIGLLGWQIGSRLVRKYIK